jgi:mycothiol maleylpyruvate isomerase-like protein
MPVDPDIFAANRAATDRIRSIADRLTDADLVTPVGEHWTPGVVFTHLAFWDRRVQLTLDATEAAGEVVVVDVDIAANDISLEVWRLVPAREAAALALRTAQAVDERLASFPPALLDQVFDTVPRWVMRHRHRNEHLDELEAALGTSATSG